eukprot:589812-Rhodomonas_salina.1
MWASESNGAVTDTSRGRHVGLDRDGTLSSGEGVVSETKYTLLAVPLCLWSLSLSLGVSLRDSYRGVTTNRTLRNQTRSTTRAEQTVRNFGSFSTDFGVQKILELGGRERERPFRYLVAPYASSVPGTAYHARRPIETLIHAGTNGARPRKGLNSV